MYLFSLTYARKNLPFREVFSELKFESSCFADLLIGVGPLFFQHNTTPPDIQFSMALTWQKSTKVVLNCQESRFYPDLFYTVLYVKQLSCRRTIA